MGARYYEPGLARMMSPDTITPSLDAQGLNPYSYVRNNPVSLIDPTGHDSQEGSDQSQMSDAVSWAEFVRISTLRSQIGDRAFELGELALLDYGDQPESTGSNDDASQARRGKSTTSPTSPTQKSLSPAPLVDADGSASMPGPDDPGTQDSQEPEPPASEPVESESGGPSADKQWAMDHPSGEFTYPTVEVVDDRAPAAAKDPCDPRVCEFIQALAGYTRPLPALTAAGLTIYALPLAVGTGLSSAPGATLAGLGAAIRLNAWRIVTRATPWGTVLIHEDEFHRAGTFVTDLIPEEGQVFWRESGDGVRRMWITVNGAVNGVAGRYEWIIDRGVLLTHQLFRPDSGR